MADGAMKIDGCGGGDEPRLLSDHSARSSSSSSSSFGVETNCVAAAAATGAEAPHPRATTAPTAATPASSALLTSAVAASQGAAAGLRASTAPAAPAPPAGLAPTSSCDGGQSNNVRVVARVRPLSSKERKEGSGESIRARPEMNTIEWLEGGATGGTNGSSGGNDKRKFEFDSVFGPDATQAEFYERTCGGEAIRRNLFGGFNQTILAYGQTGSGKTFTMGTDGGGSAAAAAASEESVGDSTCGEEELVPPADSDGVIARAVHDLFQARNSLPHGRERTQVEMSYLEIYNERAIDLLSTDPNARELAVRESKTEGVCCVGLTTHPVSNPEDIQRLMDVAAGKRVTASTHMNAVSSRSHAICTLQVTVAPLTEEAEGGDDRPSGPDVPGSPRGTDEGFRAKLTLVDLAGSERIKRTGAAGARMKEGININKGLFVLGQVVSALSESGQHQQQGGGSSNNHPAHIPYRDSKLTRLLQDSLGGNSKTVMIACISPAGSNVEESATTLRYAERTRNIKNSAVRNVVKVTSPAEVTALQEENQRLKDRLAKMEEGLQHRREGNSGSATVASTATLFRSGRESAAIRDGRSTATTIDSDFVSKLQAQCSSYQAKIEALNERSRSHKEELLEASLRADRWQAKTERIAEISRERWGADLLHEEEGAKTDDGGREGVGDGVDLITQLRTELSELKDALHEARTDVAVARAVGGFAMRGRNVDFKADFSEAGAVGAMIALAENADEGSYEDGEDDEDDDDRSHDDQLTTELTAVSATISQKEQILNGINREAACRANLQLHFESSLQQLQVEVEMLTSERDNLISKVATSVDDETAGGGGCYGRRKRKTRDDGRDPTNKNLRDRISILKERIDALKSKAAEHAKSLRMRDAAEKKCAKLMAEITEDKRRRAALQRKLKEASVEMRTEKKSARMKAARLMKDGHKLKLELSKMQRAAEKQAAVLKKKVSDAKAKEKRQANIEWKRKAAASVRTAASGEYGMSGSRKEEILGWLDREVEYSATRCQIDDQKCLLEKAESQKEKILAYGEEDAEDQQLEVQQIQSHCAALRAAVIVLESNLQETFVVCGSESAKATVDHTTTSKGFADVSTLRGLAKHEAKYVVTQIIDKLSLAKTEAMAIQANNETSTQTAVESALAKEKMKSEQEANTLMIQHTQAMGDLLQLTNETIKSEILAKIMSSDLNSEIKTAMDDIIGSYLRRCSSVRHSILSDLHTVKETQKGIKKIMYDVAQGLSVPTKKVKKTQKKRDSDEYEVVYESSDEENGAQGDDGDDSDWNPDTPSASTSNRGKRAQKKKCDAIDSESSGKLVGESISLDGDDSKKEPPKLESLTNAELKRILKQKGLSQTGKKADLIRRLQEAEDKSSDVSQNAEDQDNGVKSSAKASADVPSKSIGRLNLCSTISIADKKGITGAVAAKKPSSSVALRRTFTVSGLKGPVFNKDEVALKEAPHHDNETKSSTQVPKRVRRRSKDHHPTSIANVEGIEGPVAAKDPALSLATRPTSTRSGFESREEGDFKPAALFDKTAITDSRREKKGTPSCPLREKVAKSSSREWLRDTEIGKENILSSGVVSSKMLASSSTPKKKQLGFMSSCRRPSSPFVSPGKGLTARIRGQGILDSTPKRNKMSVKLLTASAKKRHKRGVTSAEDLTLSAKKRQKRGMNSTVMRALEMLGDGKP